MNRVYIYCEGQTEEQFVNRVMGPYLFNRNIVAIPIVCRTGSEGYKMKKGGVSSYSRIRNDLSRLCGEHRNELVTTMFDYYGLPRDTPGIDNDENELYTHIMMIEKSISDEIGYGNCIVNLIVHEFEALLFSDPSSFLQLYPDSVTKLKRIRDNYRNPEYINNSQSSAPSKRIMQCIDDYSKVDVGVSIAEKIGIERMLQECPHFRKWVESIIDNVGNHCMKI